MTIKPVLLLIFILSGCSSVVQELDPKVYYIHDLVMSVNGVSHLGLGVIPEKDRYKIKLKSAGNMSLFVFETCHRERQFTDEGKRMTLTYTPMKGIENEASCMVLKFSSFDKKKGKHAEGILLVEQPEFTESATIKCNGRKKKYNGVSVCHSKHGLYQEIVFKKEMKLKETKCSLGDIKKTAKVFRFKMPKRECIFTFSDNSKKHLLFTSGYEQILIRN